MINASEDFMTMGAAREKDRGHMPEIRKDITITKLDAAKRQLETVVRLYFHNGDPVSIHTLVAAAHTVIRDINKKRRGSPMINDDLIDAYAKPEYQKRVLAQLNEAGNFFKHADRDHAATLDFNPDQSEIWLLGCHTTVPKADRRGDPAVWSFHPMVHDQQSRAFRRIT